MIRGKKHMLFNHNNYLNYELPKNWCSEEDGDNLLIYDPNGVGAMTISFFNVLETNKKLEEQITIMAKDFTNENQIKLHKPFMLYGSTDNKITLCGSGTTSDNWYIKIWIVAKKYKIVFVTYQSENISREVDTCDAIIESFNIIL